MRMTVMWHKFEMASEKAREKGKKPIILLSFRGDKILYFFNEH